jgi:hypothetical protein
MEDLLQRFREEDNQNMDDMYLNIAPDQHSAKSYSTSTARDEERATSSSRESG